MRRGKWYTQAVLYPATSGGVNRPEAGETGYTMW
jgi:hypothetical protein